MNFEKFIEEIKKMVKEYLGDSIRVEDKTVLKNNGVKFTGIVILKENQNCVPNIYLDSYYQQYERGRDLCDIVHEIVKYYEEHKIEEHVDMECFSNYECVKNNICFRLINLEKNKELLEQIPHIPYLDMAIVFYCVVNNECIGKGNILIRNEHLKRWKADVNDIRECAFANTPELLKGQIAPMEDVVCELMRKKMICEIENSIEEQMASCVRVTEEMVEPIVKEMMDKIYTEAKGPKMYVAGNYCKNYGAAVILYENFLEKFAKEINSDFYILPSSIHEVILIPVGNDEEEVARLKYMVYEVNHTELEAEEILSDSVYRFVRQGGIIKKM